MKKVFLGLFVLLFLVSCAYKHSGGYAKVINKSGEVIQVGKKTNLGLIISCSENMRLSSKYFGMIDFTFENKTQDWIHIKNIKIDFGKKIINENVKIISGKDISRWYAAIERRIAIKDYNKQMVESVLLGVGVGLSQFSRDINVQRAGGLIGLMAGTSLLINEFNQNLDKLEKSKIFPKNHLLVEDVVIPPGLFVKKWLLLNSKNHEETSIIDKIFLEYETENGEVEKVKINLKQFGVKRWQSIWSS